MKEIPLTKGLKTIVDDEDFEWLSKRKWHTRKSRHTYYAQGDCVKNGKRTSEQMHRLIIKAKPGAEVDHINQDGLDNRRANLRIVTHGQNIRNSKFTVGRSGFYGVWLDRDKYRAGIIMARKPIHLGSFESPIDAARAYDQKCIELGRFDKLNFPNSYLC